ncbi:MAG TPA: TlpA disulfide reductase family protein [Thermoanaerobaculia bacterium]|nr:TlpA disulfide reductase family protein [Thermoanaerobaculia bacterium]
MRKILPLVGDLSGSALIIAVCAFGAAFLLQSRSLVYLLFLLPSLVALAVGIWRGRASALQPWLDLVLINLPPLGLATWLGASEGAWPLLFLAALAAPSCALGLWVARGGNRMSSGRRWLAALAMLLLANLALALLIPRFVTSLIVRRELDEPAPAFRLALLDGGAVSSQDLRGRVVVLDFWTTWCQPCRREFPELEKVYEELRASPDVAFYAVDGDRGDTPENARRFFRETGYRLPVAYDHGSKVYEAFGAPGFPTLVIIDRAGRLRFRHSGFVGAEDFAADLSRRLDRLLRER